MAHSSILFTRGQTQSLVVGVLGTDNDAQTHESLEHKAPIKERFMFHYNFLLSAWAKRVLLARLQGVN